MKKHSPARGDSRFIVACLITVLSMASAIAYVSYAKDNGDEQGASKNNFSLSQRKSNSGSNRSTSHSASRSQQRSEQSSVDFDSQGSVEEDGTTEEEGSTEERPSSKEEVESIIQQIIEEKKQQHEREQQEQQQSSMQQSEESSPGPSSVSGQTSDQQRRLGCFTQDGSWTTDRSQCAQNQQSFHQEIIDRLQETHQQTPLEIKLQERGDVESEWTASAPATDAVAPVETQVEVHIREQMKPIFVDTTRIDEKRQELLLAIQEAQTRLTLIQQSVTLPQYEDDYLTRSIGWLLSGFDYFSSERTIGEIEEMAASLKEVLTNTATIVAKVHAESGTELPRITSIVDRIQQLLDTVPSIIALLTDEGITVDEPTVIAYVDALQIFAEVREECGDTPSSCARLSEVLDHIEIMRNGIEVAITEANRLDIHEKIEAITTQ
ncbi:MAG: hypothetical protein Q7R81_07420 [Candidatus Peregrinibacteria bacterium]|nr:hypothetical protein [Candidatus Peregrinibacteria bacterium]